MKKLIITVTLLIALDLFAYYYLNQIIANLKPLDLKIEENNLIYQRKDLILDDTGSFELLDYFKVIGKPVKYLIENDFINISINNQNYQFPYTIKEKEVEIQETIVYVEKPVYETIYVQKETEVSTAYIKPQENTQIYSNSSYTYQVNTDINHIVNDILGSIDTNSPISIDFSFLNPNEKGTYTVFLNSEIDSKQITVNII